MLSSPARCDARIWATRYRQDPGGFVRGHRPHGALTADSDDAGMEIGGAAAIYDQALVSQRRPSWQ